MIADEPVAAFEPTLQALKTNGETFLGRLFQTFLFVPIVEPAERAQPQAEGR